MERGDIVIYCINNKPMIGKFVNRTFDRKIIILSKFGNRKLRKENLVLSLNELTEKYKKQIGEK